MRLAFTLVVALVAMLSPGTGSTAAPAPARSASGPALTQPADKLREATRCQSREKLRSARGVVLLVAGGVGLGWRRRTAR